MNNIIKEDIPQIIAGGIAVDDRGDVSFVNDFDFLSVKRFYMVSNHRKGFIRAWHGHKLEKKFVLCVKGSALLKAVKIDNWDNPSLDLVPDTFVLSDKKPSILYIPSGYANGFMSLTEDMKLMFFSSSSLNESLNDDYRFTANHWDSWEIESR